MARPCVAVAVSGGRDSTALLHCHGCARPQPLGIEVVALHVHHGLQRAGRRLARALQRQCAALGAARPAGRACACSACTARPARGESVEAWARRGALSRRWRAMARDARRRPGAAGPPSARPGRDLPAAGLRGAGAAGLAAMPRAGAARRHHLGAALAASSRARRSRPMCGGTACATSTTPATPTRASRATACARRCGRQLCKAFADAEAMLAAAAARSAGGAGAAERTGAGRPARPSATGRRCGWRPGAR